MGGNQPTGNVVLADDDDNLFAQSQPYLLLQIQQTNFVILVLESQNRQLQSRIQ